MAEQRRLTFLGTGGSLGVPVIGCACPVCQSGDPQNQRLRPSALLEVDGKKILIDATQDYRIQALRAGITHLDGVIFTHAHHDHSAGIDDLRVHYMHAKEPLPCLMSAETFDDLRRRYDYILAPKVRKDKLVTRLDVQLLEGDRGQTAFLGIEIQYMSYQQMGMQVNGLRFGDFAYVTDIREYPETIYEDLQGVKSLVISALRWESTHIHFGVEEAITFADRLGAERVWFTHIGHELDHTQTNASLPEHVRLAYDGQEVLL